MGYEQQNNYHFDNIFFAPKPPYLGKMGIDIGQNAVGREFLVNQGFNCIF